MVQLSAAGVHRGHEGVQALADTLHTYAVDESSPVGNLLVAGDIGLLAPGPGEARDHDRADSYIVRNGRIVAQTVHSSHLDLS